MLNQMNSEEFEEFDELIKDIDKMKFVRVDKQERNFTDDDFKDLVDSYHDEKFEDLMNMRYEGMKVNVYIQEDDGITTGLVMLMTDDTSISILDIKGKVPLNKLATLISKVQNYN